ncbi:MAG: Response regulator receiver protein [Chthoniobacteraceae bacterium]|nr:Response regulator receiver protein [Chthoniobacteraceae bacterium]
MMSQIIIAEDNDELRRLIFKVLQASGHDVVQTRDGNECLRAVQLQEPDIVLTDLLMPEAEGLELIMQLQRELPRIRIIAMSSASNTKYLAVATTFGASAVLIKPFEMADLLTTIADVMGPAKAA